MNLKKDLNHALDRLDLLAMKIEHVDPVILLEDNEAYEDSDFWFYFRANLARELKTHKPMCPFLQYVQDGKGCSECREG